MRTKLLYQVTQKLVWVGVVEVIVLMTEFYVELRFGQIDRHSSSLEIIKKIEKSVIRCALTLAEYPTKAREPSATL